MLASLELRLVIRKQGIEYLAVTEQLDGTRICTNTFQHDPAEFMLLDALQLHPQKEPASWLIRRFTRNKPRNSVEMQAAQYGVQLYQYVFGTGRKLRDFLRAQKNKQLIRLRLVFTPSTEVLNRLPWEYLNDGKVFLSVHRNIQIIRQSTKFSTIVPASTRIPLRVLALIASPADQATIKIDEEVTRLHDAFEADIIEGKVELDVLHEVTTFTLRRTLRERLYHVIYYIGFGKFDLMQQRSYLCFENAWGNTEMLGASQLNKILRQNKPHLLIIRGRSSKQTSGRDPYQIFALESIQHGTSAVLNIPAAMHLQSVDHLTKVLFNELARGKSVGESVRAARKSIFDLDETLRDDKRINWGFANLYSGVERVQPIISTQQQEALPRDMDVRNPLLFVDRKSELQNLREALRENASVISLWGHAGAGKSTLIDQLLYRTGAQLRGILRIKCDTLRDPLSVLSKIANFWAGHTPMEHRQAADLLLDSRQDPFVRAQAAQQHLGQYRYLFIFENIDVWFAEQNTQKTADGKDCIIHPLIRSILLGLLHAESNTTFIFTGARRWADLSALPSATRRDIPLPFLGTVWAYQLMASLPGLKTLTHQAKEAVYWQMGGHPLAIKLLSAWCISDNNNDLDNLLENAPVRNRSTENWITYLLNDVIDNLDPGEAQVLPITALLNRPFTGKILPNLTLISSQYAGAVLNNWRELELIQDTGIEGQYEFHPLIRNYILDRLSENEFRQLHLQAAEYYGAPFIDEARRQIYTRNASYQSEERVTWLARDINGILGTWLRQEKGNDKSQELLDLAMSWHYHLFNASEYQAAAQIARVVVPVLHRLGLRDLAGELLQRAITAAEGYDRAVRMDDLAKMQVADGHLAGALNVYEEVYKALLSHGTDTQRAHVLTRSARIQQQMGLWQDAIKRYEQALKILRQHGEQRGQVICLFQLSVIYRQQENLQQALVYSQAAKELYDKLVDDRGLASATHEQGQILRDMNHLDRALENFAESMRLCRRLGDMACVASNLYEIGNVLHKLGKTEMAIRTLEEAESLYDMLAAPERNKVLRLLEELYEKQQRLTDAVQRFRAAKQGSTKRRGFLSR